MRAPLSWIRQYVAVPADQSGRDVAERIIAAGLEVETVEVLGADVTGPIVVGRVLDLGATAQLGGQGSVPVIAELISIRALPLRGAKLVGDCGDHFINRLSLLFQLPSQLTYLLDVHPVEPGHDLLHSLCLFPWITVIQVCFQDSIALCL